VKPGITGLWQVSGRSDLSWDESVLIDVRLVSAGARAVVGSAMHPDSALVLRGYGADPGDFRARQLEDRFATEADLTLTMTRAHRREVLRLAPRALARTFTLREAADLLARLGDEPPVTGGGPAERARSLVAALAGERSRRTLDDDGDDVPDPVNRPVEVQEEAGELIAGALLPILRRVADLVAAEPAGPVGRATINDFRSCRSSGAPPAA